MGTRIAINGFGRIGRCVVRSLHKRGIEDLEVVAINDLCDAETLAHLLRYDSIHRTFEQSVSADGSSLRVGDQKISISAVRDPRELAWQELGVDVVLECTGLFTDGAKAIGHVEAGARKVLVSAPAKNHDKTIVFGVNHDEYDPVKHQIVSAGSCTTNCLAPIAKVLDDQFGLEHGLLTTVHAYTNDQHLLDLPHPKGDLRRARAAAVNMIPSSTGAARAIAQVLPHLDGKLDGVAVRVPTLDVSLVDLTLQSRESLSADAIHSAMRNAAESGPLAPVFDYTELPLVSGDFIGCPASSVFDATQTRVLGDRFAKVFAWYDNEWGFANRMIDLARLIGGRL
jgi:glyceraldehyde 3-phosphate dehydrogenase